jgi:hypothetical protein
MKLSLCSLLPSLFTSSLFGPNVLLSTLFSNTLSLYSTLTSEIKFHTYTDISYMLPIKNVSFLVTPMRSVSLLITIYFFISRLFNDAVSTSKCILSSDR